MKDESGRMKAGRGKEHSSFIPHPSSFSPWPHRLAVALACATFPLLFIGGLVTSKGAGLAVPDWPTSFGYNMFLYPWSKMVDGIFYEHSHRLVASTVGFLTIILAGTFWFKESRAWLRWLGVAALGLVIAQGVLGGLRVVLLQQPLAIVHAAFAQAFFALAVSLAVFTSAGWRDAPGEDALAEGVRLRRLGAITTGLIYIQAIFGAVLRYTGERVDAHLLFAGLVALHVIFIVIRVARTNSQQAAIARPTFWLAILLALQLLLGTAAYLGKFTSVLRLSADLLVWLTTTHLVIGASMLATALLLTLRCYRLSGTPAPLAEHNILSEQFSS
jgi:cytochrome c oxidase assembly protein subunit 15